MYKIQEISLQNDGETQATASTSHQEINRALHAMAAHLHRYASELKSLSDTMTAITRTHPLIKSRQPQVSNEAIRMIEDGLSQIHSQIMAVIDFEVELEKKIKNNLALVETLPNRLLHIY